MKRIGLISDTHGYVNPKIYTHFDECDEIWHAGDFGTIDVSIELEAFKPLRGVYGNVDGDSVRRVHPLDQRFELEGVNVFMTHIGGYPGRLERRVREEFKENPADLYICGHSHILKIMRDPKHNNLLHINPGAAGNQGFHKVCTLVRLTLDSGVIRDVQTIELGHRGSLPEGHL